MMTENVTLTTPTGEQFCGVSFRGDIEGWAARILWHAKSRSLKTLRIDGAEAVVSDGSRWPLTQCRAESYPVKRTRTRK